MQLIFGFNHNKSDFLSLGHPNQNTHTNASIDLASLAHNAPHSMPPFQRQLWIKKNPRPPSPQRTCEYNANIIRHRRRMTGIHHHTTIHENDMISIKHDFNSSQKWLPANLYIYIRGSRWRTWWTETSIVGGRSTATPLFLNIIHLVYFQRTCHPMLPWNMDGKINKWELCAPRGAFVWTWSIRICVCVCVVYCVHSLHAFSIFCCQLAMAAGTSGWSGFPCGIPSWIFNVTMIGEIDLNMKCHLKFKVDSPLNYWLMFGTEHLNWLLYSAINWVWFG